MRLICSLDVTQHVLIGSLAPVADCRPPGQILRLIGRRERESIGQHPPAIRAGYKRLHTAWRDFYFSQYFRRNYKGAKAL